MTRADARLVMVSHITNRLLKYFTANQTTRTRLLNHYTRVAAIIQSSDSSGSQFDFMRSRRTRYAREATAHGVRGSETDD